MTADAARLPRSEAPGTAGRPLAGALGFGLAALQFGLLVLVIRRFEIEGEAFGTLTTLAFLGFLVHHFLPLRHRLPFFAGLSLATTVIIVGPQSAAWIFGIGSAVISLCHLRVAAPVLVALLVAAGGGLAVARVNATPDVVPAAVWPVFGAMFMFRLIVYVHDLRHRTAPVGLFRSLAYFFMLPNACFPLFPIVDYKTWCATYFNREPLAIYRTGLLWLFRGVLQLLAYRIVYHHVLLHPLEVKELTGVIRFVVGTFLLYLRISGQFHVIVGLLHLFGFNLPETHHLYLLSSSFSDFWRRINIYWKDFITKLVFYPVSFGMLRRNPSLTIAVATLAAFFATWILHAYQTFWLLGEFSLSWQDTVFWWALALLVLVNGLLEARRGRRRTLKKTRPSVRSEAKRVLATLGTFSVICLLWTVWSCDSLSELVWLASMATRVNTRAVVVLLAGCAGLALAALWFGRSVPLRTEGTRAVESRSAAVWSTASVLVGSVALLGVHALPNFAVLDNRVAVLLSSVLQFRLNERDAELQRGGYYEELTRSRSSVAMRLALPGGLVAEQPAAPVLPLRRLRYDFLYDELEPGVTTRLANSIVTTNRWGMRDRDYEATKAAGTYRIALMGSSHEMGEGVGDGETFEQLLEERLNESASQPVEILNFAVRGHGAFQKLLMLESKAFGFQPDAVFFVTYAAEIDRTAWHLGKVLRGDVEIPERYREIITRVFRETGVDRTMPDEHIQVRLKARMPELIGFVFQELRESCRARGVEPIVVFRPSAAPAAIDAERRRLLLDLAAAADLPVLDLTGAYEGVDDVRRLMISTANDHVNAEGHRLLADRLDALLRESGGRYLPPRR